MHRVTARSCRSRSRSLKAKGVVLLNILTAIQGLLQSQRCPAVTCSLLNLCPQTAGQGLTLRASLQALEPAGLTQDRCCRCATGLPAAGLYCTNCVAVVLQDISRLSS